MATIKLTSPQKEMLKSLQYKRLNFSRDNLVATTLVANGFIFRSWYEYDYSEYAITPAGLAYLYQDAPMVDQPQLPSEVESQPFKAGDWVAWPKGQFRYAKVLAVNGDVVVLETLGLQLWHVAIQEIEKTGNDDLPFTVIGNDPDDTQELPIVKVEAKMSLSELVDAALLGATPTRRIDALRTLRNGFDWESVPSDALEAEVVDVNQAYEDAVANRRLLSSKMMNDFWGYAELKDYVKAESFTWAVNAVYVLLNKQLSHRRLHAMGAYNA